MITQVYRGTVQYGVRGDGQGFTYLVRVGSGESIAVHESRFVKVGEA